MNYDCLVVNGDSYSASRKEHLVYADFLANHFDIPVYNYAQSGSNNDRISRSSIEYLLDIKQHHNKILFVTGWSFIRRLEVWYYGSNNQVVDRIHDRSTGDTKLVTLDLLLDLNEATVEQKCLINEDSFIHKNLVDFYHNLYTFGHWLESQDIDYFWFSGALNTDCPIHAFPYIQSLKQVQWVAQNPKIHQLHEFCIMKWAKDNDPNSHPVTGHLSECGHQKFADYILDKLNLPIISI